MSTYKIEVTEFEGALALPLPDELLSAMGMGIGDTIYLAESPEGMRLISRRPEQEERPAAE